MSNALQDINILTIKEERRHLMQPFQLPVEIIARIIRLYFYNSDSGEDARNDLNAWSVIFALREVCREILFRNITYGPFGTERRRWIQIGDSLQKYPHFRKYVKSVKMVIGDCVDSIVPPPPQLTLTLSDVLPNVQSVSVSCVAHRPHHARVDCACEQYIASIFKQMKQWTNPLTLDLSNVSVPIHLLAQIPHIETLQLGDCMYYRWPVSPPHAFMTHLSSITLRNCRRGTFFIEALNNCKLLKEIRISGLEEYPRHPLPLIFTSSSSFSQLELISVDNFDCLAAVSRGGPRSLPISHFPCLKTLQVSFTDGTLRMDEILEVFCGISSVEYLSLLMYEIADHTVDIPAMIVPSLQHLCRIDLHIFQDRNYKEAQIGQLNDALISMRGRNVVRELVVTLSVDYQQDVPGPFPPRFQQLGQLVRTLSWDTLVRFPCLKSVFFLVNFKNYHEELTPNDHWIRSDFLSSHFYMLHQHPSSAFRKYSFGNFNDHVFIKAKKVTSQ